MAGQNVFPDPGKVVIEGKVQIIADPATGQPGQLQYDFITMNLPATGTTQSVPVASGIGITMTGSGRIIRVSCSALTTTTAVTPTATSLTGTSGFQDGMEVTLYNVAATGSNISISGGIGTPYVLIGQNMATFVYDAGNAVWIHKN